ncbi:MAG: SDR family oxidoreductase [Bacteriovoracaceae bacterium]|nr:SDR family oxidoreductase [Bacteriovoracaceae bacterium]
MSPKFSIVTGASSGIGLALAEILAEKKSNLILVARRIDQLEILAKKLSSQHGIACYTFQSDLTNRSEAQRLKSWCEEKKFPIDCLVNNAGNGFWGEFEKVSINQHLNMLDLNVIALTNLTGEFYPLLKKQKSWVLNVASTAAFQAIPTFAAYAASKSYVLSFSRALYHEWKPKNITVTTLCPGPTKSEFMQQAQLSHVDKIAAFFEASAHSVALSGIKGMLKNKPEVVPGFLNWMGSKLVQISPRYLSEILSGKFFH